MTLSRTSSRFPLRSRPATLTHPTLAVLITYHDERELLTQCLDSVLGQTPAPDEVIVYDDASAAPARDYVPAKTDPRVRIIRGERNAGPGAGRNALLQAATAAYAHFHDADDLLDPAWSAAVRDALGDGEPDMVLTEIVAVRDGSVVSERVLGLDQLPEVGDLVRFGLRGSLLVPSSTFRRSLALDIGGFRPRDVLAQSEDFDFHIRLAAKARSWRVVDRALVIQRLRAGSHSGDQKAVWVSAARSVALLADELPGAYHQELAESAARIGGRLYQLGARADARAAYALSRRLGRAEYPTRRAGYRMVARVAGPVAAEWLGDAVRRLRRRGPSSPTP